MKLLIFDNTIPNTKQLLGWGALATIGILSMGYILLNGHISTNNTQNLPWGLWVALYIYFIGLSAGSFLLSSLIYVFKFEKLEPVGRVALLQAFLCMVTAGILIIIDLGHPARLYKVFTSFNITSVMSWMGFFYTLYMVIIGLEIYLVTKNDFQKASGKPSLPVETLKKFKRWMFILGVIGIPVALFVHGGVGSIFAVAKARPNWFGPILPIIFIISALASGGGLLTFLSSFLLKVPEKQKLGIIQTIAFITVGFLLFDYFLLGAEILTTFYGGMPHEIASWRDVVFGPYAFVFWGLQVTFGLVIPILIILGKKRRDSVKWLALMGLSVVIGVLGTRLNIVIPAQIHPVLEGLPESNSHIRFASHYFPSLTEFLVGFGAVGIFAAMFILGLRYLPIFRHQH
ncbi:MAG: polysulfide reductase NrfD [Bacteroidetes bacterium]|nr:polysulfide reductase NrfD [Bacteroidota bacterium]